MYAKSNAKTIFPYMNIFYIVERERGEIWRLRALGYIYAFDWIKGRELLRKKKYKNEKSHIGVKCWQLLKWYLVKEKDTLFHNML